MRLLTCRHVAQPIPHGVAPQQSPAMLRLRGKGSDKGHVPSIRHQISSLQFDPLNNKSLFSACNLTYTPKIHLLFLVFCIHYYRRQSIMRQTDDTDIIRQHFCKRQLEKVFISAILSPLKGHKGLLPFKPSREKHIVNAVGNACFR